jgi:hypothetical protein
MGGRFSSSAGASGHRLIDITATSSALDILHYIMSISEGLSPLGAIEVIKLLPDDNNTQKVLSLCVGCSVNIKKKMSEIAKNCGVAIPDDLQVNSDLNMSAFVLIGHIVMLVPDERLTAEGRAFRRVYMNSIGGARNIREFTGSVDMQNKEKRAAILARWKDRLSSFDVSKHIETIADKAPHLVTSRKSILSLPSRIFWGVVLFFPNLFRYLFGWLSGVWSLAGIAFKLLVVYPMLARVFFSTLLPVTSMLAVNTLTNDFFCIEPASLKDTAIAAALSTPTSSLRAFNAYSFIIVSIFQASIGQFTSADSSFYMMVELAGLALAFDIDELRNEAEEMFTVDKTKAFFSSVQDSVKLASKEFLAILTGSGSVPVTPEIELYGISYLRAAARIDFKLVSANEAVRDEVLESFCDYSADMMDETAIGDAFSSDAVNSLLGTPGPKGSSAKKSSVEEGTETEGNTGLEDGEAIADSDKAEDGEETEEEKVGEVSSETEASPGITPSAPPKGEDTALDSPNPTISRILEAASGSKGAPGGKSGKDDL